ncbi:MAG: phosphosulfolactate synthase [Desulfotomaculaceae bacterium]
MRPATLAWRRKRGDSMNELAADNHWRRIISFPIRGRTSKPRTEGLTMVIDKGLGLNETKDLFEVAANYIDFIKLGFGTSALYTRDILAQKINLANSYGVMIYPGGTFMEIAISQNKLKEYISMVGKLGYPAIEVSDGTVNVSPEVRERAIAMALDAGLLVLTEVGKKNLRDKVRMEHYAGQIRQDLDSGAFRVIIEGRESGKDAGFYDGKGRFIADEMEHILEAVGDTNLLIWEAPLKQQQQELITQFGPNVNLGNIPSNEALALEALRVGLRGDTLRLQFE